MGSLWDVKRLWREKGQCFDQTCFQLLFFSNGVKALKYFFSREILSMFREIFYQTTPKIWWCILISLFWNCVKIVYFCALTWKFSKLDFEGHLSFAKFFKTLQEVTKIFRMENTFDDHIGASRNSGFSRTPRKMSRDSTFRTRTQSLASNGSQEGGGAKQVKVIFGSIFFCRDFRKHNPIRPRA